MDPQEPNLPRAVHDQTHSPDAGELSATNPYSSSSYPEEAILLAEMPSALAPQQPRYWSSLVVAAVSLGVFLIASLLMALLAMFVVHGSVTIELLRDEGSFQEVSRSRIGLLILVVIPQLALVIPSIVAAQLSPVPTRKRLGLVRGHWPIWAWVAAAAATPLVGLVSGMAVGIFMEESETLKQMTEIFREHGQSGFLIPLALMIGATPALCEELLFRGYIQTRLTRSFGPALGILVASVLFAAFHMDVVHVIAVFPLGLFLGVVAWRSGSLFPAMMGHFVNNVISVVAVVIAPVGQTDVLSAPTIAVSLGILGAGIVGMAAVSIAAVQYGQPATVAPSV